MVSQINRQKVALIWLLINRCRTEIDNANRVKVPKRYAYNTMQCTTDNEELAITGHLEAVYLSEHEVVAQSVRHSVRHMSNQVPMATCASLGETPLSQGGRKCLVVLVDSWKDLQSCSIGKWWEESMLWMHRITAACTELPQLRFGILDTVRTVLYVVTGTGKEAACCCAPYEAAHMPGLM